MITKTTLMTSLAEIRSFHPCPTGWKDILSAHPHTCEEDYQKQFPLVDCVESNSISNVCWLIGKRKTEINICVSFAQACADSVTSLNNKYAANAAAYADAADAYGDDAASYAADATAAAYAAATANAYADADAVANADAASYAADTASTYAAAYAANAADAAADTAATAAADAAANAVAADAEAVTVANAVADAVDAQNTKNKQFLIDAINNYSSK